MSDQSCWLVHKYSNIRIQITSDEIAFAVGNNTGYFSKPQHARILYKLSLNYPNGVSYQEIKECLGRVANSNNDIHKEIHQIRATIKNVSSKDDVITNISRYGYRVGDSWSVEDCGVIDAVLQDNLHIIGEIVNNCKTHMREKALKNTKGGILYLDFDNDFATQNFTVLDRVMWSIIDLLSSESNLAETMDLKATFSDLLSYVIYWRIGDNLTERKWRNDYESEIDNTVKKVKDLVSRMQ